MIIIIMQRVIMTPLVLLFLAVGTSHRDAVNVKRESVYSITMHEIGELALRLHATVRADARFATLASVFVQIMNATPYSTTYRSPATAIRSCAVVCVFPYKRLYLANTGPQELNLFEPPCSKLTSSF